MSQTNSVRLDNTILPVELMTVPTFWGIPNSQIAVQTGGIELSAFVGEFAIGGIEVAGFQYQYSELPDGGVLVYATHEFNETGFYLDIRNANPIQVIDPNTGRTSYTFDKTIGAVAEFGFFAGDSVVSLEGVTIGSNIHLSYLGVGAEQPVSGAESGAGWTISVGPGFGLPAPVVTGGLVVGVTTEISEADTSAAHLETPDGRTFRVINLYEQSTFDRVLEFYYAANPSEHLAPTAQIYNTSDGVAFLLNDPNGAEIYLPFSGEIVSLTSATVADQEAEITQIFEARGLSSNLLVPGVHDPQCFTAGTLVDMADGSRKAIELIQPDDLVLAYDETREGGCGELVPSRVVRTFVNQAPAILDFHGLKVTPGHVTLCGDGPFAGQHRPLIDIVRDDGAIVDRDGSLVRAATNLPVGSDGDRLIKIACYAAPSAAEPIFAETRLGTLLLRDNGDAVRISGETVPPVV
jgi:hypothetical protein